MSKESEFRKEAQKLREAAAATTHGITRETLLKLAEEYERLAVHPVTNHPKNMPELARVSFKRRPPHSAGKTKRGESNAVARRRSATQV